MCLEIRGRDERKPDEAITDDGEDGGIAHPALPWEGVGGQRNKVRWIYWVALHEAAILIAVGAKRVIGAFSIKNKRLLLLCKGVPPWLA